MATKTVCDGCKKESPDSNGLHIANHWIEIRVTAWTGRRTGSLRLDLCQDCYAKLGEVISKFKALEVKK